VPSHQDRKRRVSAGSAFATATPSPPVTLRSKLDARRTFIHYLALHPRASLGEIRRLVGTDEGVWREMSNVLNSVANRPNIGRYSLKPELFGEVDIDGYSGYSPAEREQVRQLARVELAATASGAGARDAWLVDIPTAAEPLVDRIFTEPITTLEQYDTYRRAFAAKHEYYARLDRKLQANADEFAVLKQRLDTATDDGERAHFADMIRRKHDARKSVCCEHKKEKKKLERERETDVCVCVQAVEKYTRRYNELHVQLRSLKDAVAQYVRSHDQPDDVPLE
jgi:hypothetical protein